MSSIALSCSYPKYLYSKVETFIEHSDLLENVSILALNTLALSSAVFKSIPEVVGRSTGIILNYIGVISLNNHGKFSLKSFVDLRESFRAKDWTGLTALAAKIANHIVTVSLICANMIASLALHTGRHLLAHALFRVISPMGRLFTFVSIALDCFHYYDSKEVSRRLDEMNASIDGNEQKKRLLRSLIEKTGVMEGIQRNLKPMAIRQMDAYTWDALQKEIEKTGVNAKVEQHFEAIRESSIKQKVYAKINFGLTALGYLSMTICRANRDTVLQSAILWGMSSLYTTKIVYKKYTQSEIRSHMQA